MRALAWFALGALFALGLGVSGMTQPAKVIGFLDVAGAWDPALAFVMGGAVLVTFFGYRLVLRRPLPLLAARYDVPARGAIDGRLLIGSALFGVGWGLAGFCPGPALVALASGSLDVVAFVAAMFAGFALQDWLLRPSASGSTGLGARA